MDRGRGLWVSSVFALSATITLSAVAIGPGCQSHCSDNFDCADDQFCSSLHRCERECETDLDCRSSERGLRCNTHGRCVGSFDVLRATGDRPPTGEDPDTGAAQGWDAFPGSGAAFVINSIQIADHERGFDLDGACKVLGAGCIDNALWGLGELVNDQIRQGLLGGEALWLMELAGLDEAYAGDDRSVTVKIYNGRDADDPYFPANNFKTPPGLTTCCEFEIDPKAITSDTPPQAWARAPARIERGRLTSLQPVPMRLTFTASTARTEIRLENVVVSGVVPSNLREIDQGLLGLVLPIQSLQQINNPFCADDSTRCPLFYESNMFDVAARMLDLQPDIDLDETPDGPECVFDTDGDGLIDRCCDGNGTSVCGVGSRCANPDVIEPTVADLPYSCVNDPRMADGYSIALSFSAVGARIVGFGN